MNKFYQKILLVIIALLCFHGCFLSDGKEIHIIREYVLKKSENGKFYILKENEELNAGGLVEGTIDSIGWTTNFIYALRKPTFDGDKAGWIVITENDNILGPFSKGELEKEITENNWEKAVLKSAKEAWQNEGE